jgi:predicted alpha/beta-fold hydrolase
MKFFCLAGLFLSVGMVSSLQNLQAEEVDSATIVPVPEVPDFDYTIDNGYYATVTALHSFKTPKIENEKEFKLTIDGFKKNIKVRALMQEKAAPLVVIFLGLASKSKDGMARLWQSQLYEAGNSVLVFDSVFRASFSEKSNHGVSGNLEAETRVAEKIIEAFTHHPEIEGKTLTLNVLAASYGGMLALNYAKLAKAGEIKRAPDKVLVLSPPTSLKTSVGLLDRYYDEDTHDASFYKLLKLMGAEPVANGKKVPFTNTQMRAGIGYVFHDDLKEAIDCAEDVYQLPLPESVVDKNKRYFARYVEQIVFPYWAKQKAVSTIDQLWEFGNLESLLNACGENVHAVIAQDDPLNDPMLLGSIMKNIPKSKLTVLPRGGHLGFIGTRWSRDCVVKYFSR